MNVSEDLGQFFSGEPPGLRNSAIRWLQKQVMKQALELPRHFDTLEDWEAFRDRLRRELPEVIGLPTFPELGPCPVREHLPRQAHTRLLCVHRYKGYTHLLPGPDADHALARPGLAVGARGVREAPGKGAPAGR